jgi:hypothetical protein
MSAMRATVPLCEALAQALPESPFRVELWDGSTLPPTNGTGGPTFRVRSPRALGHLLRAAGQLISALRVQQLVLDGDANASVAPTCPRMRGEGAGRVGRRATPGRGPRAVV